MSINFNELPNKKPTSLIPNGTYFATIAKAEMRTPKDDSSKPDYLNLELKLKTRDGKECGTIFDIISESDKDIVRYKVGRFIRAVDMDTAFAAAGSFSLKDLQKVVTGKNIIVDVGVQEAKNGYSAKNQIDALTREAYYKPNELDAFADAQTTILENAPLINLSNNTGATDDIPFNDTY